MNFCMGEDSCSSQTIKEGSESILLVRSYSSEPVCTLDQALQWQSAREPGDVATLKPNSYLYTRHLKFRQPLNSKNNYILFIVKWKINSIIGALGTSFRPV